MALRLIQVFLPNEQRTDFQTLISNHPIQETWEEHLTEGRLLIQMLAFTSGAPTALIGIMWGMQSRFQ